MITLRFAQRESEWWTLEALGASRFAGVQQILVEHVVQLAGAAAAGFGLAGLSMAWAKASVALPSTAVQPDVTARDIAMAATMVAAVTVPCILWRIVRLGWKSRDSRGRQAQRRRPYDWAVALQASLAVLSVAAGLWLLKGFMALQPSAPGFATSDRLIVDVVLPSAPADGVLAGVQELEARLSTVPGVMEIGVATSPPLGKELDIQATVEFRRPTSESVERRVRFRRVGPRSFQALSLSAESGRMFTDDDSRTMPRVVIVNEALARSLGDDVLRGGAIFQGLDQRRQPDGAPVVGVVPDLPAAALGLPPEPTAYATVVRGTCSAVGGQSSVRSLGDAPLCRRVCAAGDHWFRQRGSLLSRWEATGTGDTRRTWRNTLLGCPDRRGRDFGGSSGRCRCGCHAARRSPTALRE